MANETSTTITLSSTKNGATVTGGANGSGSKSYDMAGTEMIGAVQTFTTSESAVSLGGCDSVEALYIKNLDGTNDLTIGFANPIVTVLSVIKPGGSILVTGVSTTLYGKSSASTVDANVVCAED
jgi:hypothetical protein